MSTATVNVIVTDVNDSPPVFVGVPYSFRYQKNNNVIFHFFKKYLL